MADSKDELAARRWFRWRLIEIGEQYPHLKQPVSQERLTDKLDQQQEKEPPCPNNPPATPAADPKGAAR